MTSFRGAFEAIGLRAVIIDARQYLADGRKITEINKQITASQERAAATAVKSSALNTQAINAQIVAEKARLRATVESLNAQRLQIAADAAAKGRSVKGTFLGKGEDVAIIQAAKNAQIDKAAAIKIANEATKQEIALGAAAVRGETARAASLQKTAAAELRLAAAQKSKLSAGVGTAGLVGAGIAIGVGAAALSQASKFEDSLTKIDNLTNVTAADSQKLGKDILEMTKTFPKSADDLGASAYFILSSGITSVKEAQEILTQSAKAATGAFGDTKEVAQAAVGVLNAYGKENINATQIIDILFAAVKEGSAEFSDFVQNIGRVTNIGRTLGVTFDQLAAATAGLTNVGLPAHQAVTALLGILNQLFSPSEGAKNALLDVGSSIEEVRANIREKGLLPALQEMLVLFGGNQQALEELFPDIRGLGGALALLRDNGEANNRILKNTQESVGIVDDAFTNAKKNFSQTAQLLKNELNRGLIQLGTHALPLVTVAMKVFLDNVKLLGTLVRGAFGVPETIGNAIEAMINGLLSGLEKIRGPLNDIIDIANKANPFNKIPKLGDVGRLDIGEILGAGGLNKTMEETGEAANRANQDLKKIPPSFTDVSLAATEAAKELTKLQEEFRKSSQDAGRVEPLDFSDLFGDVSQEFAKALNIGALGAGNVQGFDAVANAVSRADSAAFNFVSILGTVAAAFEQSASVGTRIVSDLARSALSAAQSAASAVFSRPTREVADLNLELAKLESAASAAANSSRSLVKSLRSQLSGLDDQIKSVQKQAQKDQEAQRQTDKARDRARKQADEAAREADKARERAEKAVLDQLRIANLQARHAYERFNEKLEALIEAAHEQASSLQEAFLKSNEDLQRQIQAAIGQGDTAGAMSLIDQQRQQADAYNDEAEAIQDNIDGLEKQQRAAARAEAEAQRQRELAEAFAQAQANATSSTSSHTESVDEDTSSTEKSTEATDAQIESLEKQKETIQEQIEAASEGTTAEKDKTEKIKEQIKQYEAETAVLKAMIDASDLTLLTQKEQAAAVSILSKDIRTASQFIRENAKSVLDLVPGVNAEKLRAIFDALEGSILALTDESFRNNLIDRGIDPAAIRLAALATETDKATAAAKAKASADLAAAGAVTTYVRKFGFGIDEIIRKAKELNEQNARDEGGAGSFAIGGYTGNRGGVVHPNEFVIPAGTPSRAKEVFASMPPSLKAAMLGSGGGGGNTFNMPINVSGETLDSMEQMAMAAVHKAFRDARVASQRGGSNLSSGLSTI